MLYIHSYLGKMNPFWRSYFSNGLVQPPTRLYAQVLRSQNFGPKLELHMNAGIPESPGAWFTRKPAMSLGKLFRWWKIWTPKWGETFKHCPFAAAKKDQKGSKANMYSQKWFPCFPQCRICWNLVVIVRYFLLYVCESSECRETSIFWEVLVPTIEKVANLKPKKPPARLRCCYHLDDYLLVEHHETGGFGNKAARDVKWAGAEMYRNQKKDVLTQCSVGG